MKYTSSILKTCFYPIIPVFFLNANNSDAFAVSIGLNKDFLPSPHASTYPLPSLHRLHYWFFYSNIGANAFR
ncbi:MAG: hypothetical protein ACI923_000358 [Flavobacteriales bacterium]|jgi:hypothetical protein